jgi:hypothetical protein
MYRPHHVIRIPQKPTQLHFHCCKKISRQKFFTKTFVERLVMTLRELMIERILFAITEEELQEVFEDLYTITDEEFLDLYESIFTFQG